MAEVLVERLEAVELITLNRPDRMNALTIPMVAALTSRVTAASADDHCRAIVITGAGRGFCSGSDTSAWDGGSLTPLQSKERLWKGYHLLVRAIDATDKPVIAAINGAAVGAGMDIALGCDIRYMADSAYMSEAYVQVGLIPGNGGAYFLPRLVGVPRALELLWTGRRVEATEAVKLGLANSTYANGEVVAAALAFAQLIAKQPPLVIQYTKRAVKQSLTCDLITALDLLSSHVAVIRSTEDSNEALAARRERRAPRFTGK